MAAWFAPLWLTVALSGCGGGDGDEIAGARKTASASPLREGAMALAAIPADAIYDSPATPAGTPPPPPTR